MVVDHVHDDHMLMMMVMQERINWLFVDCKYVFSFVFVFNINFYWCNLLIHGVSVTIVRSD